MTINQLFSLAWWLKKWPRDNRGRFMPHTGVPKGLTEYMHRNESVGRKAPVNVVWYG